MAKREFTFSVKKSIRVSVLAIILSLLAGCAGSPVRIGMMDAEGLTRVETLDLCYDYSPNDYHDAKIRPELERRNAFTEREWKAIEQTKIFIGMSELAFQCSWTMKYFVLHYTNFIISKEGPWGIRTIYEYISYFSDSSNEEDDIPGAWPKRVYVEDSRIVAYQETTDIWQNGCFWNRALECWDFNGLVSTSVSDAWLPPIVWGAPLLPR